MKIYEVLYTSCKHFSPNEINYWCFLWHSSKSLKHLNLWFGALWIIGLLNSVLSLASQCEHKHGFSSKDCVIHQIAFTWALSNLLTGLQVAGGVFICDSSVGGFRKSLPPLSCISRKQFPSKYEWEMVLLVENINEIWGPSLRCGFPTRQAAGSAGFLTFKTCQLGSCSLSHP